MDWKAIQLRLKVLPDGLPGPKTYQALFDYVAGKPTPKGLGIGAAKYFAKYGMTTPERIADFLGQTAHESANYTHFEENLNYSAAGALKTFPAHFNKALADWANRNPERIAEVAYGVKSRQGHGRMGNTKPGDGYKYRGRGILQLTGKDNYSAYSKYMGIDILNQPETAADPEISLLIALEYYRQRKIYTHIDKRDYVSARKAVNGGTLGLAHVNDFRKKALSILT